MSKPTRRIQVGIKRMIDILASASGLLVLLPVFAIVAAMVRISSVGPILFRQRRIGRGGKNFTILKFRTMLQNAPDVRNKDQSTYNSEDDPRITKIGQFLRKMSLDETPQLINVLWGDMSLIGPRPELPDGVSTYEPHHFERLNVRPGISGLAIIHGRNQVPVSRRRDLDVEYAQNWTPGMDIRILLITVLLVVRRIGVNHQRQAGC